MAFLDFIKNRQAGQQQRVAGNTREQKAEVQKPQASKEQGVQEKTNQKPVEQMPEAAKAKAREIGERIDKATQHLHQNAPAQSSSPSDASGSPEAMRQKMTAQDKSAPALSPTSAQAGTPATEKNAPAPSNEPPVKTPEKPAQQPQPTVPRRAPSWER